ncbi:hypothetical protein AALP_AA1G125400 [Arabis alpina]|uniref:GPI mannosyltransferase 2 n=1 Tax=Arabis alpina TaxID=50452 RepID=A0A087HMT7_ARAAL|nr:hypothetical protein AALP_AA1G125400 [Arabis alpina]
MRPSPSEQQQRSRRRLEQRALYMPFSRCEEKQGGGNTFLDQILKYPLEDADVKTSPNEGNRDFRQRKPSRKKDATVTNVASESNSLEKSGYFSADVFPFVVHLGLMAATAFVAMHVQVATRFLSANPPLYWFASHLIASPKNKYPRPWVYLP